MPPRGGVHGAKVVASVGSDPQDGMRLHQGNARPGREGDGALLARFCKRWFWGVRCGVKGDAVHRCKTRPMHSGMVAPAEAIFRFLRLGVRLCGTLFTNHEGGNQPCWPPTARIKSWLSGIPPESGCGVILTGTIFMTSGTSTLFMNSGTCKKEEGGVVVDLRKSMIFRGSIQKSENGIVK